jgi:large subunit ribosomal protein L6e
MTTSAQLVPGISRLSRSQSYAKRALFKKKKAAAPAAKPAPATTKTVKMKGGKNGASRVVAVTKSSKFYPADDIPQPKVSRKTVTKAPLRASITPGTVLILLAGRFRGKRVVFLKQLDSGLLLVTGPHKINGVPLRRVNQAYVIATSTHLDISKVKVDAKLNDAYFKVAKSEKVKPTAEALFGEGREVFLLILFDAISLFQSNPDHYSLLIEIRG